MYLGANAYKKKKKKRSSRSHHKITLPLAGWVGVCFCLVCALVIYPLFFLDPPSPLSFSSSKLALELFVYQALWMNEEGGRVQAH